MKVNYALLYLLMVTSTLAMGQNKAESAYPFTASMTYQLSVKDRKGKETNMTTQYYFQEKGSAVGIKLLESSAGKLGGMDMMILDIPKARMFTFMENKMVVGMSFKPDKFNEMVESENASIKVTKTSETKTIMGRACEGYAIQNDKDKSQIIMWVSKDKMEELARLAKQMAQGMVGGMGKNNPPNYFAYNTHPELAKIAQEGRGVLGYTTRSEKGEISEMELIKLEPKINYTFNASDYKSLF